MCVLERCLFRRDVCIREMSAIERCLYKRDVYIREMFALEKCRGQLLDVDRFRGVQLFHYEYCSTTHYLHYRTVSDVSSEGPSSEITNPLILVCLLSNTHNGFCLKFTIKDIVI